MTTQRHAAIWDMDGVLIDSGDLHYATWRETFAAELNLPLARADFDATFGHDNYATLTLLLGEPPSPELMARIGQVKERLFRERAARDVQALPGAVELVRALAAAGWEQAIATSAPRENLDLIVRLLDLDEYLTTRVCIDDVSEGKPNPALFQLAAERMGVPPARCVVIEDAPTGIAAAHAAGMVCLALATTHPAHDLAQAERVIESLAGVGPQDLAALLPRG